MTVENSKRLYDHYLTIGRDKAAKDLLNKYPQFKDEEKPKAVQSGEDKGATGSKGDTGKKK